MIIIETSRALKLKIGELRADGKQIGFVPTMGALHDGHLSLVRKCKSENDICVVSIFVNPIQFNNPKDLEKYPRTFDADCNLLEDVCDILFVPSVEEMYPEKTIEESYDFGELEKYMEGEHRPGHFNGVAVVVRRLFEMTNPHKAYFGLKDYQQLAVIKALVRKLSLPIDIIPCETVREKDGLAMSSRNKLLTHDQRLSANLISKTLFEVRNNLKDFKTIESLKELVIDKINADSNLAVEYFEVADAESLVPTTNLNSNVEKVACIAVKAGDVRLIDNIII